MEWHIEYCKFEKRNSIEEAAAEAEDGEGVVLTSGVDELEKVTEREKEERSLHVYRLTKESPLFSLEMRWVFDPEDEDLDEESLKTWVKNTIEWEGSHEVAHYLKSMELPPIPSLLDDFPEEEEDAQDQKED